MSRKIKLGLNKIDNFIADVWRTDLISCEDMTVQPSIRPNLLFFQVTKNVKITKYSADLFLVQLHVCHVEQGANQLSSTWIFFELHFKQPWCKNFGKCQQPSNCQSFFENSWKKPIKLSFFFFHQWPIQLPSFCHRRCITFCATAFGKKSSIFIGFKLSFEKFFLGFLN